jgi:hypothetical protein
MLEFYSHTEQVLQPVHEDLHIGNHVVALHSLILDIVGHVAVLGNIKSRIVAIIQHQHQVDADDDSEPHVHVQFLFVKLLSHIVQLSGHSLQLLRHIVQLPGHGLQLLRHLVMIKLQLTLHIILSGFNITHLGEKNTRDK